MRDIKVLNGTMSEEEQMQYVYKLEAEHKKEIDTLEITIDGEYVDLHYRFKPLKFERIRRITGYLVGTLDNWNNAKASEEADRVKHSTGIEQL